MKLFNLNADKKKALWEAFKEAGRIFVIGVLSAAVSAATYFTGLITDPAWNVVVASVVGVVTKAIDKFMHKLESVNVNGVVPF